MMDQQAEFKRRVKARFYNLLTEALDRYVEFSNNPRSFRPYKAASDALLAESEKIAGRLWDCLQVNKAAESFVEECEERNKNGSEGNTGSDQRSPVSDTVLATGETGQDAAQSDE